MILTKEKGQRMWGGGFGKGSGCTGSGGSGGGGGSTPYAAEAGHAQEADHAMLADDATNASYATRAGSAAEADWATEAQNLASDSTDWQKIADKTIVQTIAEVWTFAKGIISTLKSYFNGGIEVTGGTKTDTLQATGNATVGGTLGVTGNTTIGGTLGVTGNTTLGGTLNVTGKTTGTTADFTDVTMDNLGKSNDRVAKIWADDIDAQDIATENLNVTKEAHFTKLVVDELLSNKGAIIISSANCVAEAVVEYNQYYAVFFSMTDGNGNAVTNPWRQGDLALCLTFKAEGAGTFNDAKNKYYWRKVIAVNSNVSYDGNRYHLACLSKVSGEYEGSTVPEIGDNIVQLGYTGSDAAYRQSAVILSSYPTMDAGVTPPSLAFYKGINDFSLSTHRYTFVDGLNNEFMGNFKILVNGSYTNLTSVLATLEGLITTVKKTVRGKNILPLGGWTDGYGELLGSENYEEARQMLTNAHGSSFEDVVYSPIFFLAAGTYTFSCYTTETALELWLYGDGNNKQTPFDFIDAINTYTLSNVVSGDTYQSAQRRYVTFTLDSDNYVCLNMYENSLFTMYRPMLEIGDSCSAWECGNQEFSSQVKQTAEGYNISIRDNLGLTGIDISNHTIELRADKVTFANSAGTVSGKVQIDTEKGTLITQDAVLRGNLYLPYLRLTNLNINNYVITNFYGQTVVNLGTAGNNLQVEVNNVTIRLPRITPDMLGCEINIFNATSGTIEISGSGVTGSSASGAYFCNLLVPSLATDLRTNSTVTLQKFRELKAKAFYHGLVGSEAYNYGWLVCYANINP